MIGELALALALGGNAVDIGITIHPQPTLGESIGMAAEVAHGSCRDVPPARKCPLTHSRLAFYLKTKITAFI